MRESKIGVVFFISGGGTTADAVIRSSLEPKGRLHGLIVPRLVISNRENVPGIRKIEAINEEFGVEIPVEVVKRRDFSNRDDFGEKIIGHIDTHGGDMGSQNGWNALTPANVVRRFKRKIINQHPAPLDPGRMYGREPLDFGGKGMVGTAAVAATLAYRWSTNGDQWTEATTHFVTEGERYDQGDLMRTEKVDVPQPRRIYTIDDLEEDSTELLDVTKQFHTNVLLPIEHENVIETLALFAESGDVKGFRREVPLIPDGNEHIFFRSKPLGIKIAA